MASRVPAVPASLRSIQHHLKTATEHDERDIVISYWCRLYALQTALKIDKSSPEAKTLLLYLMDWLERVKGEHKDNESIMHDIPAQAYIENYALKLFLWADSKDRAGIFDKSVVKTFFTSGLLFDVLETFGELTEEIQNNRKYAKWKAAYIHNCLKAGETPVSGPINEEEDQIDPLVGFPQARHLSDIPEASRSQSQDAGGPGLPPPAYQPPPPATHPTQPPPAYQPPPPATQPIQPFQPAVQPTSSGSRLTADQMTKAQKYCKFASSALNYEDIPTAVSNLQKALTLLTTGMDE